MIPFSRMGDTGSSLFDPLTVLLQSVMFAVSSVHNQKIYQSSEGSFHAMNMVLFGYSTIVNLMIQGAASIRSLDTISPIENRMSSTVSTVLSGVAIGVSTATAL